MRIPAGTVSLTSASSDATPSAFNIPAISASPGPTWRRTKSAGGRSRARAPAGAVTEAGSDTGLLGS